MISPIGMTLSYWIHTLTVDFPNDIIPVVLDEKDWIQYCNTVANSPTFAKLGVPNAELFPDWQKWAERVYGLLG